MTTEKKMIKDNYCLQVRTDPNCQYSIVNSVCETVELLPVGCQPNGSKEASKIQDPRWLKCRCETKRYLMAIISEI